MFEGPAQKNPYMVELITRAHKEGSFTVEFETSRRAESFRRIFYKFRSKLMREVSEDERVILGMLTTSVEGKTFVIRTRIHQIPAEVLKALKEKADA